MSPATGPTWRANRTYTPMVIYSPTRSTGTARTPSSRCGTSGRSSGGNYAIGYAECSSILTVGPDRDFTTIQAAINGAYNGDTILVDAGTYSESLIIDKQLTVVSVAGAASTIIDYGDPYVVQISSSNVVFDGFTVPTPATPGALTPGIVVPASPR